MMLGEESESADYWKKRGDEALAHGIKGVVIMVSIAIILWTEAKLRQLVFHIGGALGHTRRQHRG